MINASTVIDDSLESTTYMLTKAVNGIRNNMTEDFLEDSDKYCFVIDGDCNPACSAFNGGIDSLKDQGMDFSFVYAPGCTNINNYSALSSNNSIYQMVLENGRLAFSEFVFDHIFDKAEEPVKIISAAGLTELPNDFGAISATSKQDYDNDGLLDIQEINFNVLDSNGNMLVTINSDGSIELPSFNKCVETGGTYIESGLKRFYDEADENILSQLDEIKVLPIISDPTSEDGDGDGILDFDEYKIINEDDDEISTFSRSAYYANTISDKDGDGISDDVEEKIQELNPSRQDTVESLYSGLVGTLKWKGNFWIGTKHQELETFNTYSNPVYIYAKDNTINIIVNCKFDGDEKVIIKNHSYDAEQLIKEAIRDRWEVSFTGSDYDFYPGMKIDIKVYFRDEFALDSDDCGYVTVYVSNKAGMSEADPTWQIDKNKTVKLYSVQSGKNNDYYEYTLEQYKGTVAHEFGHVFGLGDISKAYSDMNRKSNFSYEGYVVDSINNCDDREIWCNVKVGFTETQYTEGCGDIMMYAGDVLPNDVEMLVMAFATGRRQNFLFDGFSTAIKDKENNIIVYHVATGKDKIVIKYYTLNLKNNKLKEIKNSEVPLDKKTIDEVSPYDIIYNCPEYPN